MNIAQKHVVPCQTFTDPLPITDDKHVALMKANLLMDLYFDD